MAENESSDTAQRCLACGSGHYRKAVVARCNALVRGGARLIGFFGFTGAIYGVIVALSGFDGHYGAYPKGQLIARSLLVGLTILAISVGLGLVSWYLLENKPVTRCDRCGDVQTR